ncbi:MAG TPA: roadblock/LC7 domain-containing protein [Egibacteraceae bacterium]|nr:roadblock/LC7 domain-containing protein [Egibacteraceae bacterium]
MSDTTPERLAAELNDFMHAAPDVEAASVASREGVTLASALPEDTDIDGIGTLSAELLVLAEQAATHFDRGNVRQLFVEGDRGFVFLLAAGDQAVLTAVTARTASLGPVVHEMRRSADALAGILAAPDTGEALARKLTDLGLGDEAEASMFDFDASDASRG